MITDVSPEEMAEEFIRTCPVMAAILLVWIGGKKRYGKRPQEVSKLGVSVVFKVMDGPLIGEINSEAQPNC